MYFTHTISISKPQRREVTFTQSTRHSAAQPQTQPSPPLQYHRPPLTRNQPTCLATDPAAPTTPSKSTGTSRPWPTVPAVTRRVFHPSPLSHLPFTSQPSPHTLRLPLPPLHRKPLPPAPSTPPRALFRIVTEQPSRPRPRIRLERQLCHRRVQPPFRKRGRAGQRFAGRRGGRARVARRGRARGGAELVRGPGVHCAGVRISLGEDGLEGRELLGRDVPCVGGRRHDLNILVGICFASTCWTAGPAGEEDPLWRRKGDWGGVERSGVV